MTDPTLLGTDGHTAATSYTLGTYYNNVGLGRCPMNASRFTTESYASQTIRVPGTISYLSWALDAGFGALLTLTLNKNSSSTTLAVSFPSTVTGWVTDSTHSVTVSSGDQLDFAANVGTTTSYNGDFYCISARFDASTASAQLLATVGWARISPSSTPKFVNFLGILGEGDTTESNQQFECLAPGTWQHMACNVESNDFTEATYVHNRVNDSDGSMIITIPSDHNGYFEAPNADSDSVSYGDLLDYKLISQVDGSNGFTMYWIGAHLVATDSTQCMIGGTPAGGNISVDAGITYYTSLFGGGNYVQGSLPRTTGLFPYALSASNFTSYITATSSSGAGSATFTVLKNGSASALAVSSSAGQTGYFTTANSDTVTFAQGDTCANQIVGTGGTGTSVTWAGAAVLLTSA